MCNFFTKSFNYKHIKIVNLNKSLNMRKQTKNAKFEFVKYKVIFENFNIIPKIKLFFAIVAFMSD